MTGPHDPLTTDPPAADLPAADLLTADLLTEVLELRPAAFALLHRPEAHSADLLDVLVGEVTEVSRLADIPLPAPTAGIGDHHDVLAVVPYRQISERGFVCTDDGAPLLTMTVTGQQTLPTATALARLPDLPIPVSGGHFDVSDADYAETVRTVLKEAIGEGEGANFVIKRSFLIDLGDYSPRSALAFFRRLLQGESGAYWTFVVHTGARTFVGASPERHITVREGVATMNPVSGTYRYPPSGPTLPEVLDFLADRKESDELYMVLDEELKMMTRICEPGVRVTGPQLSEMAQLAHTGYFIDGASSWDVRDILRESLFAPTVTGSPLESACRVVSRYEPEGRGYYSGVLALVGRDATGGRTLDSSILIRTAEIDAAGRARIGVGATLVRHSDPESEVAETRAKAAGLLSALGTGGGVPHGTRTAPLGTHPRVRTELQRRNATLGGFWLGSDTERAPEFPELVGCRTLVVDAEDTFTSMINHQLRSMGMAVTVRGHDDIPSFEGYDVVVLGPGPGDPLAVDHPKISRLRTAAADLLAERRPFLAVCLSHQVLSSLLGFPLQRRDTPNQGVQKQIDLFGTPERVGFYNSFAARSAEDRHEIDGIGTVDVCRDPGTGEVHALRGPRFSSCQFHAESVLTQNGPSLLGSFIGRTLAE